MKDQCQVSSLSDIKALEHLDSDNENINFENNGHCDHSLIKDSDQETKFLHPLLCKKAKKWMKDNFNGDIKFFSLPEFKKHGLTRE